MQRFYTSVIALVALPLVNCAMLMPPPQQGQPQEGAQEPAEESGTPRTTSAGFTPSGGPSHGSPQAPQAKSAGGPSSTPILTTVEIHSDCTKTTPVFYGEKPKFGSGTKSSIGSNTTTSASRKSDGTLTVWIIDEQENPIASVHVGPTTRRVEIDRSCRQITAR